MDVPWIKNTSMSTVSALQTCNRQNIIDARDTRFLKIHNWARLYSTLYFDLSQLLAFWSLQIIVAKDLAPVCRLVEDTSWQCTLRQRQIVRYNNLKIDAKYFTLTKRQSTPNRVLRRRLTRTSLTKRQSTPYRALRRLLARSFLHETTATNYIGATATYSRYNSFYLCDCHM